MNGLNNTHADQWHIYEGHLDNAWGSIRSGIAFLECAAAVFSHTRNITDNERALAIDEVQSMIATANELLNKITANEAVLSEY